MAEANVVVTLTDPDKYRSATTSPYGFAATKINLYRYATEAAARADTNGSGGALVATFTLVATTTEPSDPNIAGPYRYGTYDASQVASTWYRYLLTDDSSASPLSEPWDADNRPSWALRDILFEVGDMMGQSVLKGTAATNVTANLVICTSLFKSAARDARFYENWWLGCSYDAGGAGGAPEGEEALVASVDTSTGTATLDRDLSAAVTASDIVLLSAYMRPSAMVRAINRARERMKMIVTHDIALTRHENRYPVPYGVRAEADVFDVLGVFVDGATNSNRQEEFRLDYRVEFDGYQGWILLDEYPGISNVARLRLERSYRDVEGNLTAMGDTTMAPIEWMRPVGALACVEALLEDDPTEATFQQMRDRFEREAMRASAMYAPQITRRMRKRQPQLSGPRWAP